MYQYFKGPNSTESHTPLTEAQRESVAKDEAFALNAKLVTFMAQLNPQCTVEMRCHTVRCRAPCKHHFSQWWTKYGASWDKFITYDDREEDSETILSTSGVTNRDASSAI